MYQLKRKNKEAMTTDAKTLDLLGLPLDKQGWPREYKALAVPSFGKKEHWTMTTDETLDAIGRTLYAALEGHGTNAALAAIKQLLNDGVLLTLEQAALLLTAGADRLAKYLETSAERDYNPDSADLEAVVRSMGNKDALELISEHWITKEQAEARVQAARLDEAHQWLMSEGLDKKARLKWKQERMAKLQGQ